MNDLDLQGLDDLNLRILAELCADGRVQYAELARRLRLSPNTVRDRVVAMQRRGIIRGFHAIVDPTWYGKARALIVLRRAAHSRTEADDELDTHWNAPGDGPAVLKTWRAAGPFALMLDMAGRSHEELLEYVRRVVYPLGYAQARLMPIGPSLKPSRIAKEGSTDLRLGTQVTVSASVRRQIETEAPL